MRNTVAVGTKIFKLTKSKQCSPVAVVVTDYASGHNTTRKEYVPTPVLVSEYKAKFPFLLVMNLVTIVSSPSKNRRPISWMRWLDDNDKAVYIQRSRRLANLKMCPEKKSIVPAELDRSIIGKNRENPRIKKGREDTSVRRGGFV